ncbi:hypothetical protein HK104_011310, partial [Borealophlyctis nickersoniae]
MPETTAETAVYLSKTPLREEWPSDPEAVLHATSYHEHSSLAGLKQDESNDLNGGSMYFDAEGCKQEPEVAEEDEDESEEDEDEEEVISPDRKPFVPVLSRGKNAPRSAQRINDKARPDTPLLANAPAAAGFGTLGNGSGHYTILPDSRYEQKYEVEEELSVLIAAHRTSQPKLVLYYLFCILSGGVLYILCRWFTKLELWFKTVRCPLADATVVSLTSEWGEIEVERVKKDSFDGTVGDVFPFSEARKAREVEVFGIKDEAARSAAMPCLIHFEYRYIRFILNPMTGQFEPNWTWSDPGWTSINKALEGLNGSRIIEQRRLIFGRNAVNIKEKPILRLAVDEVLHPFYVFQVASIILWCLDDYYYYAACIFFISTSSAILTLVETRNTMRRMREISRFSCEVKVWRGGQCIVLPSEDMVPGDIYEVTPRALHVFPCDSILLDGDCIVNESMLTGESVPVSKSPITDYELRTLDFEIEDPASSNRMARFFLFSGTKIIRVRAGRRSGYTTPREVDGALNDSGTTTPQPGALALCVRTAFNTTKGSLVRSMLFPKPNKFKFYRDSFRFIGVLAMIAGLGFIASFYNFILLHVEPTMIFVRALDLITIVVPPALPATMAIGTSFAISRLRKGDIFCTSPPRVNICGKLELMVFDKTGTLTQEGLDVLGFRFTVPKSDKADSPAEPAAGIPLRFSALYRSVAAVVATSPPASEAGASSDSLNRPVSGTSVRLAVMPGHPNGSDPDFPFPLIVCAMATCHSIKVVNGELLGDPMDLRMFEFTGWHIEEGGAVARGSQASVAGRLGVKKTPMIVRPPGTLAHTKRRDSGKLVLTELGVVRSFEFASGLRRMSVIVRRLRFADEFAFGPDWDGSSEHLVEAPSALGGMPKSPKEFDVFVKGAPEVMRSICRPETLPQDYDRQLSAYAHHGYRVIACAWRRLEGSSLAKVLKMKRDTVECDLQFLGFIVFENKLKPGTTPVVDVLRKARIRQIMCTGDNVLTAISVSRECGLVDPDDTTFVPRFVGPAPPHSEEAQIVWEDVDGSGATLDPETFLPTAGKRFRRKRSDFDNLDIEPKPLNGFTHDGDGRDNGADDVDIDEDEDDDEDSDVAVTIDPVLASVGQYDLAVTGDVFQWMLEYASNESFNRMLVKAQIFARMSPDQKHFLVENLQDIGYCVGFCGDGANDCGALKAADVGLSLSEAEASVAAPFTSRSTDLSCVLRVIREGRAALVTSFTCFKYMALYSLIQFTSVSLLYSLAGNLGDFQFLFIDLALIIPVAVFMGQSGPYSRIHRKRPTASLVSKKVLTSLIGQVVIQAAFQMWIFVWVRRQPWYRPPEGTVDEKIYKSYENTAVFLLSCFQYLAVALVFSVGPPYRESMWKNVPFVITIVILFSFVTWATLIPTPFIDDILDLIAFPWAGRLYIFCVAIGNAVLSAVAEYYVFPLVAKGVGTAAAVGKRGDAGNG